MSGNSTLHKTFQGPNMPLPMIAAFKREDIVITGKLLTLVKRKGLLFNCYSSVAFRHVAVLRNGMLLVYETDRVGWTLDMKQMLKMKTTMMHTKNDNMRRLQLEFKTTRGAISMVAIGSDSARWMDALSGVLKEPEEVEDDVTVAGVDEEEVDDKCSTVTLIEEEGVISPLTDKPESRDKTPLKSQESNSAVSSCSTTYSVVLRYAEPNSIISSLSETPKRMPLRSMTMPQSSQKKKMMTRNLTQPAFGYRRPASPLPPTATPTNSSATESIRHGVHSVATLRNMLEARTRASIRKVRSTKKSTAGVPTAIVMAEEKKVIQEEAEEMSRDKKPSLRCRPSKSAPAAVALPLGKKIIVGNYSGCFDSSHA